MTIKYRTRRSNVSDSFLARQPEKSIRTRFFGLTDHWPVVGKNDYVVEAVDCDTNEILGVGHLFVFGTVGEVALIVDENAQGRGIGRGLMNHFDALALANGLKVLAGEVLTINQSMLALATKTGYKISAGEDYTTKRIVKKVN